MLALPSRLPLKVKPEGPYTLDRSNPLTRDLVFFTDFNLGRHEWIKGFQLTHESTCAKRGSISGHGLNIDAGAVNTPTWFNAAAYSNLTVVLVFHAHAALDSGGYLVSARSSGAGNRLYIQENSGNLGFTFGSTLLGASQPIKVGALNVAILTYDGTTGEGFVNGVSSGSSGASASGFDSNLSFGRYNLGSGTGSNVDLLYCGIYDRTFSAREVKEISERPFQVFRKGLSVYFPAGAAAGSYTLVADPGSYTVTGQDADLRVARNITAEVGSYSYTGTAADLLKGFRIGLDAGSYSLTGQATTLRYNRIIDAVAGSYTYTGQDATLTYTPATGDYSIVAEAGSYSLTGQDASLVAARSLSANAGSYSYSGIDANLRLGFSLSADSGSYSVSGQDVQFSRNYALDAETGAYVQTGFSATLTYTGSTSWSVQPNATTIWTEQDEDNSNWIIQ